jgi:hypothetical protein
VQGAGTSDALHHLDKHSTLFCRCHDSRARLGSPINNAHSCRRRHAVVIFLQAGGPARDQKCQALMDVPQRRLRWCICLAAGAAVQCLQCRLMLHGELLYRPKTILIYLSAAWPRLCAGTVIAWNTRCNPTPRTLDLNPRDWAAWLYARGTAAPQRSA